MTSDSRMTIYGRNSSVAETTDVLPYAMKMSDYTNMGTFSAAEVGLWLTLFFIGAGLVAMRPASETDLEKCTAPNPYNTIRWGSGGIGKIQLLPGCSVSYIRTVR